MELELKRPLLFFDIESTGLNIPADSIIELSFVKVFPGGEQRVKTWRNTPWYYERQGQRPIDPGASAVNGVTDDMLTGCPRFLEVCDEVQDWLDGADLAGFNSAKFDLPMLAEELERARLYAHKAIRVDLHEALMVDVQAIFHTMEPRNLRAAYRFYCGGADFENAHTAEADTIATYEVLKGQLDRYPDTLKNDVEALAAYTGRKTVDFSGNLVLDADGDAVIAFGKHKGHKAREIFDREPSYFAWVQNSNFTLDTKQQFKKLAEQFKAEKSRPLSDEQTREAGEALAARFNTGKLF
ncbi:MAG: 3'-5' exonuclease [Bacteroidales bacterium]|nr:3'-5' exonuclease [Bacteroidales bacterium]